jgi:two-component system, NarL family, response regulator LiaR
VSHKIRVMLVDHHQLVLSGLASFLSSFDDIEMVGEALNGEAALHHIEQQMPDVMILEMLIPGTIDALETIRRVRTLHPDTKIVVMTGYADNARIVAALGIGALGYVRPEADPNDLLSAVRAAARGQAVLDPPIACALIQELIHGETSHHKLSAREQTILRQCALGRTYDEIAALLAIAPEAIQTHIGAILIKLQLVYRKQAMLYALKKGLITIDEIGLL